MTLTRANTEAILVQRAGPLMTKAGMAVTIVGTNASLNDPIGWALRQAGYSVAAPALVTDADIASVTEAGLDTFLDYAEYRLLLNILTNLTLVDTRVGSRAESLSQLSSQIERRLNLLSGVLGIGVGVLTEGIITYNFSEHGGDGLSDE